MAVAAARLEDLLRNEADMAFRRRVRAVMDMLHPEPGDRILDAGCGHGFYLHLLEELGYTRGIGVEYSQFWVDQARAHLPTGAQLVRGDVSCLPVAGESFDKVILSEVLEHVPDDQAVMAEVRRTLRPGGVVAITVPHANYPFLWDPVNWVLERSLRTHLPKEPLWLGGIWADHYRLYTPEQLCELVESAGFRVVEVRHLTHYCFPFAHHLYYGVGKYLLLSGLLPGALEDAADRFRHNANSGSRLNPINLAVTMLRAIDAMNDRRSSYDSYLNIALKAVRQ